MESVYQDAAVSEETGRVKEVSEVNEEKKAVIPPWRLVWSITQLCMT